MWASKGGPMSLSFFANFALVFTPLFVAFDIFGLLPIFIGMTSQFKGKEKTKLINKASLTALIVALVFLFAGHGIFAFLGITSDDFRIGGGCLLFLLSISELLFSEQQEKRRLPSGDAAVVPLGVPLLAGPAVLTTIIMLADQFGYLLVFFCVILNLFICWLSLINSARILKILGHNASLALGKIAALVLLAFGIMLIRVGLTNIIHAVH
jgi:multiple antibiotic resistance protein